MKGKAQGRFRSPYPYCSCRQWVQGKGFTRLLQLKKGLCRLWKSKRAAKIFCAPGLALRRHCAKPRPWIKSHDAPRPRPPTFSWPPPGITPRASSSRLRNRSAARMWKPGDSKACQAGKSARRRNTDTAPPAHAGGLLRETWRFFVARCRRFSMCLSSLNEAANWPGL